MTTFEDWLRVTQGKTDDILDWLRDIEKNISLQNKRLETMEEYRERKIRESEDLNCYGMPLKPGEWL